MNRRGRAFTLAELSVACFLGILVVAILYEGFSYFGKEAAERPAASMTMEQSTLALLRWLQRDLNETNLQSILSLPNAGGVVFESPRDVNDHLMFSGQPNVPSVGVPIGGLQWAKYISYSVAQISSPPVPPPPSLPVGGTTVNPVQLGSLEYDECPVPTAPMVAAAMPVEPTLPPSPLPAFNPTRHRTLMHNILMGPAQLIGMHVYYTDSQGANPLDFTATQRGEPVVVSITLLDMSSHTGKPTVRHLLMQVKPKN